MPPISMRTPRATSVMPKLRAEPPYVMVPTSRSLWNTWKIVKPKEISDKDVRITDINVRSALKRVRWKAMPVRRAASSTLIRPESDCDVTFSVIRLPRGSLSLSHCDILLTWGVEGISATPDFLVEVLERLRSHQPVRCVDRQWARAVRLRT